MTDTLDLPHLQQNLVFLKPKLESKKYNKVINNFLVKSKNFDYLESCYKLKPSSTSSQSHLHKKSNVFIYTEPKINIVKSRKADSNNETQLISPKSNMSSNENKQSLMQSFQVPEKPEVTEGGGGGKSLFSTKFLHRKSNSVLNSPKINPFGTGFVKGNPLRLNADSTQNTFQLRSNSVSQNNSMVSSNNYQAFDNTMRRKSSLEQQIYLDQDEVISKQFLEMNKSVHLPDLSATEQKLRDSLIKISTQKSSSAYPLNVSISKENTNAIQNNNSSFKQLQNNLSTLIQPDQLQKLIELKQNNDQQDQISSEKNGSMIKIINQSEQGDADTLSQKNVGLLKNNKIQQRRKKVQSLHLDDKTDKGKQLNPKYVLEKRIFQEMDDPNKFETHLDNLRQRPNQVHLLEDELNQYLPKIQMGSETNLRISNHTIHNEYQNYYHSVCNYLNEFNHSLNEKHHVFDFKSYYSQHQESMKHQEKQYQAIQKYSSALHAYEIVTPARLTDINYYKHLDQVQQYKAQQIYSLLMNLNNNFVHLQSVKKSRTKTLKVLNQITGFNDLMKSIVMEEDQITMKRNVDFCQGFSLETWKLVHSKNLKNIDSLKKIPIETKLGIDYVPVDEAWNIYQIFQYFNQNLFTYIQNKLFVSERQRRTDLNGYMQNIQSMRYQQSNKPIISNKQLKELDIFDKNVQDIFERGQYIKKEQVIKRLEKYELAKGSFPFVGQLVRLKSKQIDKAHDVFRNKFKD